MLIYTGNADGKSLDKVVELGMGLMIASSATREGSFKRYSEVPCALDNGAFQSWRRGFPFMEGAFLQTIEKAYKDGLSLDFIVCPDIVGGGMRSLEFSLEWANGKLKTAPNLALAVQDGMTPDHLSSYHLERFSYLFVGGTVDWKWNTAEEWCEFAHGRGLRVHIGQCGQLKYLRAAQRYGADSVDSTTFVRNQAWHIVEEFRGCAQMEIGTEVSASKPDPTESP